MVTTPSQQTRTQTLLPLLAICLGYFMTILDVTIVNVALVDIREHLSANVTGLQWIVDGYALVLPAMTEAAISHAPRPQSEIASGMLNVSRQVGGVIGVAILGTLVGNPQTFLWGMHLAFVIAGSVLILGLVAAWVFVRTRHGTP